MKIMKKCVLLLVVAIVATMLTACSNDDVAISKTVNFTVNPSTVIGAFSVAEENAGELESFDTNCRLNVSLYVYDEAGDLVEKFGDTYSNYAVQFKASSFLPQGKYTAVAVTRIKDTVDNIEYWNVSGEEKLEGMRITDAGYVGGQNKVLGVSVSSFNVTDDVVDMNINVQPAGSMMTIRYYDYRALYSYDFTKFTLFSNKTMDYLEFDRSGNTEVIADNHNGNFDWIVDYIDASKYDSGYSYIYSYEYFLPMTNVGLQFYTEDESSYYNLGNSTNFSTQAGSCYYAYLYLSSNVDNISTSFGSYMNRSRGNSSNDKGLLYLPVENKCRNSITKGQTLKIIDLI